MGFHAITADFQLKIDEFQNRTIDAEVISEIEDILEDYCCTLEEMYGISLSFDLEVSEEDGRLRYGVSPDTDFDGELLMHITHNEASVARTSLRLH